MAHLARIQRIIDYIEQHLDQALSPETLALQSGYTLWHFQHVFRAITGEPVMQYVRSRRLTAALLEIVESEAKLGSIAAKFRFESAAVFSRAFKKHFGITARQARQQGGQGLACKAKPKITFVYLDNLYKGEGMEPRIEEAAERHVLGISAKFISILSPDRSNAKVIPALWDKFLPRIKEVVQRKGAYNLGVCEAVPSEQRTHPEQALYSACVEVDSGLIASAIPTGMQLKTIPAGRYAVFTHSGSLAKLEHSMRYIYGAWLPRSGLELRAAPDLELYDDRFKPQAEDSQFEIHIPVC